MEIALIIGILTFMGVYFIGWLATTIWMGLNHERHKDSNAVMWTIVNVISPYFGLIGFLLNRRIVRKEQITQSTSFNEVEAW